MTIDFVWREVGGSVSGIELCASQRKKLELRGVGARQQVPCNVLQPQLAIRVSVL